MFLSSVGPQLVKLEVVCFFSRRGRKLGPQKNGPDYRLCCTERFLPKEARLGPTEDLQATVIPRSPCRNIKDT
jgi:hypothetical protein